MCVLNWVLLQCIALNKKANIMVDYLTVEPYILCSQF